MIFTYDSSDLFPNPRAVDNKDDLKPLRLIRFPYGPLVGPASTSLKKYSVKHKAASVKKLIGDRILI